MRGEVALMSNSFRNAAEAVADQRAKAAQAKRLAVRVTLAIFAVAAVAGAVLGVCL